MCKTVHCNLKVKLQIVLRAGVYRWFAACEVERVLAGLASLGLHSGWPGIGIRWYKWVDAPARVMRYVKGGEYGEDVGACPSLMPQP